MILIDTQSVEIIPEVSPRDPSIITHSKLKIIKVLSLEDWNQHPTTEKRFSRHFSPPSYNYFDYQEAWYKVLYDTNPMHSWYISFKKELPHNMPAWFIEWFLFAGPVKSILPKPVVNYFENFKTLTPQLPLPLKLINFCSAMGVSWLFQQFYEVHQHLAQPFPKHLCLKVKVWWWKKYNIRSEMWISFPYK